MSNLNFLQNFELEQIIEMEIPLNSKENLADERLRI